MNQQVLQWIWDAYHANAIRGWMVDYQGIKLDSFTHHCNMHGRIPFEIGNQHAKTLREHNIPVFHFLYNKRTQDPTKPFPYFDCPPAIKADPETDFAVVIPGPDEWVYPKNHPNGFTNPHAAALINATSSHIPLDTFTGVLANICLRETIIGSFENAVTPENHRALAVTDGTDLTSPPHLYAQGICEELEEIKPGLGRNFKHATTAEIAQSLNYARKYASDPTKRP